VPTYAYVAYQGPQETTGRLDAPDETTAREMLRSDGMIVTKLGADRVSGGLSREIRLRKALKLSDVAWMARQLAITTESGMSLTQALLMLSRQRAKTSIGRVVEDMHTRLLAGSELCAWR